VFDTLIDKIGSLSNNYASAHNNKLTSKLASTAAAAADGSTSFFASAACSGSAAPLLLPLPSPAAAAATAVAPPRVIYGSIIIRSFNFYRVYGQGLHTFSVFCDHYFVLCAVISSLFYQPKCYMFVLLDTN
jgi:hypothetical protein